MLLGKGTGKFVQRRVSTNLQFVKQTHKKQNNNNTVSAKTNKANHNKTRFMPLYKLITEKYMSTYNM